MEILPAPNVFGNAIFCDDIRMEIGGKLTFVGCYINDMYVHSSFPVVLPKFCIAVNYWQRRSNLILPVVFWVFLPGDSEEKASLEFGTTEHVTEELVEQQRIMAIESGVEKPEFATFSTQIALANFTILQPGYIKVRVRRKDQLVRIGILRVQSTPNQPLET
jgi:hypothetical protein